MKRALAVLGLVIVAALAAWMLRKRDASPDSEGRPEEASRASTAPSALSPAPGTGRASPSPAARPSSTAPAGSSVCEIHVTTLGTPAREVEIRSVDALTAEPPAAGVVRVTTRPGARIGVMLAGAAISMVRVDVPDPVPTRVDVRVPAESD